MEIFDDGNRQQKCRIYTNWLYCIEFKHFKKGYTVIDSKTANIKYVKKTKLGKFLNQFFKEDIIVQITENGVSIFAKKNVLDSIVMKLKYDKTNG